jgi:Flp pilus assembly protein TadD
MIGKGNHNFTSSTHISSAMQPDVLTLQTKDQLAFARLEKAYAKNDFKKAEKLGRRLWKSYKTDCTFLKLMGLIKVKLEKVDEGIKYTKEAQKFDPSDESTINLAHFYAAQNNAAEALNELNSVEKFDADYLSGFHLKINLLKKKGDYDLANEELKVYLKEHPNNGQLHYLRGKVLIEMGDDDKALEYLIKSYDLTEVKKTKGYIAQDIGVIYNHKGDKEEALKFYNKSVKNDPHNSSSLRMIALLGGSKGKVELLKIAEEAFDNVKNKYERGEVLYCLADSAKANKEYDLAIDFYKAGAKHILESRIEDKLYHPRRKSQIAKFLLEIFNNYNPELPCSNLQDDITKTFIVGMPRSGTTLTESIIGAHSKVEPLGELGFLMGAVNRVDFKQSEVSKHDGIVEFSERIMKSYSKPVDKKANGKEFVIDKLPANAHVIGFALAGSENTKVINLDRDPVAVAWSLFSRFFPASQMAFSYDIDMILNDYKMYMLMMNYWHQKFPGRIFDLNYEKMTFEQEETTIKLIEYYGIELEENCLNFQNSERLVKTASSQQVKQGMYQGSSKEWKKYGSFLDQYSDEFYSIRENALQDRQQFYDNSNYKYLTN